jgi:hypothetical protein
VLRATLILAAFWFVADAFFLQMGLISLILVLLCIVWMGPSVYVARKVPLLLRFRAGRLAAYLLAASLALGVVWANSALAERRARIVVAAVQQYHQKHGVYPPQLEDITPEFLPSIPVARYAVMWNRFHYFPSAAQAPLLGYVVYPPFLRRIYSFESGTWSQQD